jgi:hypothetical protein
VVAVSLDSVAAKTECCQTERAATGGWERESSTEEREHKSESSKGRWERESSEGAWERETSCQTDWETYADVC